MWQRSTPNHWVLRCHQGPFERIFDPIRSGLGAKSGKLSFLIGPAKGDEIKAIVIKSQKKSAFNQFLCVLEMISIKSQISRSFKDLKDFCSTDGKAHVFYTANDFSFLLSESPKPFIHLLQLRPLCQITGPGEAQRVSHPWSSWTQHTPNSTQVMTLLQAPQLATITTWGWKEKTKHEKKDFRIPVKATPPPRIPAWESTCGRSDNIFLSLVRFADGKCRVTHWNLRYRWVSALAHNSRQHGRAHFLGSPSWLA